MRLNSGLVARCLLFKELLCLCGQIVALLFGSGHLWVMLELWDLVGLRGRVGSTGVQPLLLAGPTCLFAGNKKTAITLVIAVSVFGLSNQGINTSIDPSAVMLT